MATDAVSPTSGSIPLRDGAVHADQLGTRRLLAVLISGVVLGGRIAIPLGGSQQVPLVIPFAIGVLLFGVQRRVLVVSAPRVWIYSITMAILTALTLCDAAMGRAVSLLSVVLMLAIYLATVFRARRFELSDASWLHRFIVRLMTGVAVVTLIQFAIQFVGVAWTDWLQRVIPARFLLTGYNTGNPIYYGSPIYRPNGVLFLEPSFVSLFLGVAIVMGFSMRIGVLPVLVMVAALVTTVAGNGFVVVFAGLAVLAFRQKQRALPLLLATAAIVVVTLMTPLGHLILSRTTELSSTGGTTSSDQRLAAPYQILVPSFLRSPSTIVFGQGPGAAARIIDSDGRGTGVIAATVPKLLVEYGIVGAITFLIFAVVVLTPGFRRYTCALGLCINYFVINAGLLQAVISLATFILLGLAVPDAPARALPRRLRQSAPPYRTQSRSGRVAVADS